MSEEQFLTTDELLDYLHINLRTVYRLIKSGNLPAVRVGRQWRFRKHDDRRLARPPTNRAARPTATRMGPRAVPTSWSSTTSRRCATCWPRPWRSPTTTSTRRTTARSAIDKLRAVDYDLLITDLKMPGMDGLSVIREARRLAPDLPIVIITGAFDRGERDRGDQPRRSRLSDQAVPAAAHSRSRRARRGRDAPRRSEV